MAAAAATEVGNPAVNVGIFLAFVAVTLVIVFRASRNNRTATDYYAGGRSFTGPQNGIAIAGDYLSAASFLGIAGAIALNGYDGFMYSIGFLVAWLVALLLVAGAGLMTLWVLAKYGFNLSELLGGTKTVAGAQVPLTTPGLQYGLTETSKLDFVSLGLALVLGTAGLPHVLMRFYTVPTAKDARRSVVWAIWLIGIFYLFSLVIGYGAGALVGADAILGAPGAVNAAAPLLAFELGGTVLLGIIAGVAFATILAVVAGLTITASASFAHDVYANVIKRGNVPPNGEVRVARITAVVIGAISIGLGILALQAGLNIAFLVALAVAVAASANLPTILYTLFWKNFTTQGALWSIYGGLIACVTLIIFSPVVSGAPVIEATGKSPPLLQDVDFSWFPLNNPGLVSIPLSFFLGWLGTKLSKEEPDELKNAELEVRALTGIGAEKAVAH